MKYAVKKCFRFFYTKRFTLFYCLHCAHAEIKILDSFHIRGGNNKRDRSAPALYSHRPALCRIDKLAKAVFCFACIKYLCIQFAHISIIAQLANWSRVTKHTQCEKKASV